MVGVLARGRLRTSVRIAAETRRERNGQSLCNMVLDRRHCFGIPISLAGDAVDDRKSAQLAVCSQIHSTLNRISSFARGRCSDSSELLDHPWRKYLAPSLVWHRARDYRTDADGQTRGTTGGKIMSWLVAVLIPIALIAFVTGQLFLKRAMESSAAKGFRDAKVMSFLGYGVLAMTVHFFLMLGLLAHLDLSYVYPFQGLSVIIISLAAAIVLREKLNFRLTLGALLISAGIVLVSLS